MAVDAWPLIHSIAEHYAAEATAVGGLFPGEEVMVIDRLTDESQVLAIMYHVLDNDIMDNTMAGNGGTSRVVFTLTALSQQRSNVTLLAAWLCDRIGNTVEFFERPAPSDVVTRRPRYSISGYNDDRLPENQDLTLNMEVMAAEERTIAHPAVLMSCYNEGFSTDYNAEIDTWTGECVFISFIHNQVTEDYIYA